MKLALSCDCGDCMHWEIIGASDTEDATLKCMTCGHEYPVTLDVPEHDKLEWVAQKED